KSSGDEYRRSQRGADQKNDKRILPAKHKCTASMVHPALMKIRRSGDWQGGLQVRWTAGGQEVLRGAEIRLAHGADIAIGPRQTGSPLDRIVTILHFPDQGVVLLAIRTKTSPRVLHDHAIAALHKVVDIPRTWPQIFIV